MAQVLPVIQIKVNSSGSWANLITCNSGQYRDVKAACEILAKASKGPVSFKAFDTASGELIEFYRDGEWRSQERKD